MAARNNQGVGAQTRRGTGLTRPATARENRVTVNLPNQASQRLRSSAVRPSSVVRPSSSSTLLALPLPSFISAAFIIRLHKYYFCAAIWDLKLSISVRQCPILRAYPGLSGLRLFVRLLLVLCPVVYRGLWGADHLFLALHSQET